MSVNEQIILAKRPQGMPEESDFILEERPLPVPQAGKFWYGPYTCRWIRICGAE